MTFFEDKMHLTLATLKNRQMEEGKKHPQIIRYLLCQGSFHTVFLYRLNIWIYNFSIQPWWEMFEIQPGTMSIWEMKCETETTVIIVFFHVVNAATSRKAKSSCLLQKPIWWCGVVWGFLCVGGFFCSVFWFCFFMK